MEHETTHQQMLNEISYRGGEEWKLDIALWSVETGTPVGFLSVRTIFRGCCFRLRVSLSLVFSSSETFLELKTCACFQR